MADRRQARLDIQNLRAALGLSGIPAPTQAQKLARVQAAFLGDEPTQPITSQQPFTPQQGFLNYHFIDSTCVKTLRYDAAREIMEIQFPSGATYHYFGVSEDEIYYFSLAPSLGKFFNRNVKGHYAYARMS